MRNEGKDEGRSGGILGAAGFVSLATLISRILGVGREMVMAHYFGAGLFTDAFNVAYRIPNLLRDLFAEGALSSAFVPTFIRTLKEGGKEKACLLANKVISALVVILGGFTLLIYFGARYFVYLLASGYADIPEKMELTVQMTRIMSPFLLFAALAAVLMGMLNAFSSFFIPAMAPSAFNVCSILAGVFLSPYMPRFGLSPVVSMAIGAIAGGAAQFLVQLPPARRTGFRLRWILDFSDPGLRKIATLMLPAIVGLSATQINIMVDNQLASHYGNGPVSWLNYAFRLMQLPIGLFGVAIATVTLTSVSRHAAQNATDRLAETVTSSLRLAACLTFPATAGLIIFRHEIIRLLYERKAFLPADTVETGKVLLLYALALFAYSGVKILVPTFYALNDTKTPVRTSITTVVVKIAVNFILVLRMGYLGLAFATALASWLNFGLLAVKLNRRLGKDFDLKGIGVYFRIGAASVAMGGIAFLAFRGVIFLLPGNSRWMLAVHLTAAILAGMTVLLPLLSAVKVDDLNGVQGMIRRRFFPGKK